jgi:hypothetical protein
VRQEECQELVERVSLCHRFLCPAQSNLLTLVQFARQAAIHPEILLNCTEICVTLAGKDLKAFATTIGNMVDGLLQVYQRHATSIEQLPPGRSALIDVSIDTPDIEPQFDRQSPREQELLHRIRKMAVCGKPSDYFNPAIEARPPESYVRIR